MKTTKLVPAILFAALATSCSPTTPIPHAIPVGDFDGGKSLIEGLRNMQQIFEAGGKTAEEIWRLKRKISR